MADMFDWVEKLADELYENGQARIARMIWDLPNNNSEGRIEEVKAALPELLAAARSMENPWLEIYARHYALNCRVVSNGEGDSALPEAVALMELAHRDETRACPQSICATQDIVSCYGMVDGPGWADERIALAEETMARIDSSRVCFRCLAEECGYAIRDAGRPQEALEYIREQERQFDGTVGSIVRIDRMKADLLRILGRSEEALAVIDAVDSNHWSDDDAERTERAITRARILVDLGRVAEAKETLPDFNSLNPGSYPGWCAAAAGIASAMENLNDWQLARQMMRAMRHMKQVGAHRHLFDTAMLHGQLALARVAPQAARAAQSLGESALPFLRAPLGADTKLAGLVAQIAALPAQAALPVAPDEWIAWLRAQEGERNPEREIEWLLAARAVLPDDEAIADLAASALNACGETDARLALLDKFVADHPLNQSGPLHSLLNALLENNDYAALERLADRLDAAHSVMAHWVRARLAFAREDWNRVRQEVDALVASQPSMLGARRLAVNAAIYGHDCADALKRLDDIRQLTQEPEADDDWNILVAASVLGDWARVRETAARLGMELEPGDGPVQENWGWIEVQFGDESPIQQCAAIRTGPVTARVAQISLPNRVQHVRDEVVFHASPLNQPPEDEEARKDFTYVFRVLETVNKAGWQSWMVDGPGPAPEQYHVLRDAMNKEGIDCWVWSGADYLITDQESEDKAQIAGIYFALAAAPEVPAEKVDHLLTELTRDWPRPVSWRDLAAQAGRDTAPHEVIIARYGL
ncbi:MAG: hypothetical protein LBG66_00115 [Gallionellaceae bacterium]|jgi:hypothetical protein|nr:hypothetical protein [Gallionellaceae bacterium]